MDFEAFILSRQTFDAIRFLMLGISMTMLVRVGYGYWQSPPSAGGSQYTEAKTKVKRSSAKVSEILSG